VRSVHLSAIQPRTTWPPIDLFILIISENNWKVQFHGIHPRHRRSRHPECAPTFPAAANGEILHTRFVYFTLFICLSVITQIFINFVCSSYSSYVMRHTRQVSLKTAFVIIEKMPITSIYRELNEARECGADLPWLSPGTRTLWAILCLQQLKISDLYVLLSSFLLLVQSCYQNMQNKFQEALHMQTARLPVDFTEVNSLSALAILSIFPQVHESQIMNPRCKDSNVRTLCYSVHFQQTWFGNVQT
jgi:hypothetical protein